MINTFLVFLISINAYTYLSASVITDSALKNFKNKDYTAAFEILDKGCKENDADSCFAITLKHDKFNLNTNQAMVYLRKSCKLGQPDGCKKLGHLYDNDQYSVRLMRTFEHYCNMGYESSCKKLKNTNKNRLLPANNEKALIYYNKAISKYNTMCMKGDIKYCMGLAAMYTHGTTLIFNPVKAVKPLSIACDQNKVEACDSLGLLYTGRDSYDLLDGKKTVAYYTKACNLGYGGSCRSLGELYNEGNIIRYNFNMAKKYIGLACDLNEFFACERYKELLTQ